MAGTLKALSNQGEQQASVNREKSSLWNMTRFSQLFHKLPDKEIEQEFATLKSLDLTDPLGAVDASVRFESFQKTALHALVPFQRRLQDGQSAQELVRKDTIDKIKADKNGVEIRQLLATTKSPTEIAKMASGALTPDHILIALASPVSEVLGVTPKQRDAIAERLITKDPLYQGAVKQEQTALAEITAVEDAINKFGATIDKALDDHRANTPGLMSKLER